jgi:hypothetical protein
MKKRKREKKNLQRLYAKKVLIGKTDTKSGTKPFKSKALEVCTNTTVTVKPTISIGKQKFNHVPSISPKKRQLGNIIHRISNIGTGGTGPDSPKRRINKRK